MKNVTSYLLIIILFLGLGFVYTGNTENYFFQVGVIFILVAVLIWTIIFIHDKKKIDELHDVVNVEKERLIKNGEKIKISLENLEIKSNSWTEEVLVDHSTPSFLNELGGSSHSNTENIQFNVNTFIIEIPYMNETINYIVDVEMEITTLRMKFAIQEHTYLYLDKVDSDNSYLDLEFLDQ